MAQVRVLIVDYGATRDLGHVVLESLRSSAGLDFQVQQNTLSANFQERFSDDSWITKPDFNPHIIIFVLSDLHSSITAALLTLVKQRFPRIPVIAAIQDEQSEGIFKLLEIGFEDFITLPIKALEIHLRIRRLLEGHSWENSISQSIKEKIGLQQLVGGSATFLSEIRKIPLLAKCDKTIFITGETGTGKDLCARAIHYLSFRCHKAFVPINCGAIPVDLVENELFGHERGAFTGATTSRAGLIHQADGGSIFLDEIDCLPLPAQVKLLRFLQDKEYRPLGSEKIKRADVRLMAAMNINPMEALEKGRLREDLYYRLNVIPLCLPPLRERSEDIPLLAHHFLEKFSCETNKPKIEFSREALRLLLGYEWPGNVRELEHVVERAVVLSEDQIIQAKEIVLPTLKRDCQESFHDAKIKFEKTYIERLLVAHDGNITQAARAAQKNRRAFWELVRKYHIDIPALKARRASA